MVFVEVVESLNSGGLGVIRADLDKVVAEHREAELAMEGHVTTFELGILVRTTGEKSGAGGVVSVLLNFFLAESSMTSFSKKGNAGIITVIA